MNGVKIVELVKELIKSPSGVIVLFALLIVFVLDGQANSMEEGSLRTALLWFDRIALISIFFVFVWLLVNHYDKLSRKFESLRLLNNVDPAKLTSVPVIEEANAKYSILWVDDQPENNLYEKLAFEAQGIKVDLALTTDKALSMLQNRKYSAIISDIKREEGEQEGYVLLNKVRESKNEIPFFIYANANEPEQKAMAKSKGAQGMTNQAQELYQMVMKEAH
ncbi:MAG: response regulator [Fibromonadales bacterium]|nr:response regulator [Fibromonadales bacterium]